MIALTETSIKLLQKCLKKHNSELLLLLDDLEITEYEVEFYNHLRDIVSNELVTNGLKKDSEPNEYGLELENLIDEIGRLFLR